MYCLHEKIFVPRCQKRSCKRSWEQARKTLELIPFAGLSEHGGIGTSATRASIIEKLLKQQWVAPQLHLHIKNIWKLLTAGLKSMSHQRFLFFPKQGRQRGWRLAAVHQGCWSGIGGLFEQEKIPSDKTWWHDETRQEIHKFKQKKDYESVIESFWLPVRPEASSRGCSHWNYKTTSPPSLQAWMKPVPILRLWSSQKVKSVWTAVNH